MQAWRKRVEIITRFQKCLRRATAAATRGEAAAAEAAARRLIKLHAIDPTKVTNNSLYDYTDFSENVLLLQLRAEHLATIQKRKNKRRKIRQLVRRDDFDRIRVLLNEGRTCKEIGKQLGYLSNTVNSVRYRFAIDHKRPHEWMKDSNGKWQWITLETAGQPGGERHAGSRD